MITVDCFIYGPQLDNHVGVELAIYLAEKLPEHTIVLAHAGGCELLKTMLLTRSVDNIYYDLSLTCNYLEHTSVYPDMVNALHYWGDQFMYGTDYPDMPFEESQRVMEKMCAEAGLPESKIEKIFYGNAISIYGM